LKRLLADTELDQAILKEAAAGNFYRLHAAAPVLIKQSKSLVYQSAGLAAFFVSIAQHSGANQSAPTMKMR